MNARDKLIRYDLFVKYTTVSGLPSRKLNEGICAVCGQKIEPENTSEKTCRLSCGHMYLYFFMRNLL